MFRLKYPSLVLVTLLLLASIIKVQLQEVENDPNVISDQVKIEKILKSIPVKVSEGSYRGNLLDRLSNLGLSVSRVSVVKIVKEDYGNPPYMGLYKRGDVDYGFSTNEPNTAAATLCPIASIFYLTKRGNSWIPDSQTAHFLMSGMCK
ncbi:MAG: hypothetical protein P4L42_03500 [Desulfocapsaceae bacterium]|nr:hypothetical protein [Desulfocapsaceae bacterium]